MDFHWRPVKFVAVAGAIGGLLCWVDSEAVGTPLELGARRRMPGLAVNSDLLMEGIGSRGDTPVGEVIERNRHLRVPPR